MDSLFDMLNDDDFGFEEFMQMMAALQLAENKMRAEKAWSTEVSKPLSQDWAAKRYIRINLDKGQYLEIRNIGAGTITAESQVVDFDTPVTMVQTSRFPVSGTLHTGGIMGDVQMNGEVVSVVNIDPTTDQRHDDQKNDVTLRYTINGEERVVTIESQRRVVVETSSCQCGNPNCNNFPTEEVVVEAEYACVDDYDIGTWHIFDNDDVTMS